MSTTAVTRAGSALSWADLARCSAALASVGASLVAVAFAVPVLRGDAGGGPVITGVALAALAVWQMGWGLRALSADDLPVASTAVAIGTVAAAGWVAAGVSAGPVGPVTAVPAAVLSGAVVPLALLARRYAAAGAPARRVPVAALAVAAIAVSALATPAMAASPAGRTTSPHGHSAPATSEPAPGAGDAAPAGAHSGHPGRAGMYRRTADRARWAASARLAR